MKKILITGANGFFASRFADFYKSKYAVTGLTHQQLDITDASQTVKVIQANNPDYVVHAAAISDTALCQNNPELSQAVNVSGSVNVAKAAEACNARLIYLSSDQVYIGNVNSGPYREDEPVNPNNVYGRHKLQAETEILRFMPEAIILRLTWLFGLPERNKKINSNLIWNIAKAMMKNEPASFPVNDYRGVTYIYELIEKFEKIFDLPCGIYNAGSENDLNVYELAETVFKAMGFKNRIEAVLRKDEERFRDRPRDLRISNQKLKSGGIAFSSSEDAIKRCVKDFSFGAA
jgi:dTDP-4-dehydrorhamnose reductase